MKCAEKKKCLEPFRTVPIYKIFIEAIESFTKSFIFFESVFLYGFRVLFFFILSVCLKKH
jgi:hypothetical protein